MKTTQYFLIGLTTAFLFASCGNKKGVYDASGIFEATEVIVSAQASGELMRLDITEGRILKTGEQVGYIDTIQLHLKKMQLLSSMKAVESRHYNVSRQIAAIEQQIATQQTERVRFENLVRTNAATQKQLDDINSSIAVLQKQLAAQKEQLENNNNSVAGESTGLSMQVAQIEDQIRKSIVSSPINGTILAKYAEQGELAAPGRALFKIADMDNLFLRAYVTADQLTAIKVGQQVKVYSDKGESGRTEHSGVISWVSDKAEFTPKTIQTRDQRANLVYAIKVAVRNDGYIKKGMYGEISF